MKGQYRVSVKENVATKVINTNSRWKYLSIFPGGRIAATTGDCSPKGPAWGRCIRRIRLN